MSLAAPSFVLTHFRPLLPPHRLEQAQSFAWLSAAHARAEATRLRASGDHAAEEAFDEEAFRARIAKRLARFGCSPEKIATRGHAVPDCTHTRWDAMEIYQLDARPEGEGMLARTRFFQRATDGVLARFFAEDDTPPSDVVHVTCSGYASPSAAQRLVAAKGWGETTRVTHAYHMGCYAAFPALRMASGFLAAPGGLRSGPPRAEIVHTELCSLHLNPSVHSPEQLVVQSLFADGFVRYTMVPREAPRSAPALAVLALREEVVPGSAEAMSWICSDWGMQMTLAREVPDAIGASIDGFVGRLLAQTGLSGSETRRRAVFAVHPGGPKIIERVQSMLDLSPAQVAHSQAILRAHGNMSSATLPHVWAAIAADRAVAEGTPIVSLAFGPGLTVCGGVFRKE